MKIEIKYLVLTIAVLLLILIGALVLSPRVGEVVIQEQGQTVSFDEKHYEVPEKVPEGFVRYSAITDAVVYKCLNDDNTFSFFEYIGDDNYIHYDINRPDYLVKTNFDKRIYQIKDANGNLTDQYRAFDGYVWQVVSKNYNVLIEIPKNYLTLKTMSNLYVIKEENGTISYKLLTYINGNYMWVSPDLTTQTWFKIEVPNTFTKTEIFNVYHNQETNLYKRVIKFNDINQTTTVVDCDKDGKFILEQPNTQPVETNTDVATNKFTDS